MGPHPQCGYGPTSHYSGGWLHARLHAQVRNFARTLTCMRVEEAGRRAVVRLSAAHSPGQDYFLYFLIEEECLRTEIHEKPARAYKPLVM